MKQSLNVSQIIFDLDYWLGLQVVTKKLDDAERKQLMVALREYLGPIPSHQLVPAPMDGRVRLAFECPNDWCLSQLTMSCDPESTLAKGTAHATCPGCYGSMKLLPRKVQCPTCRGYGKLCVDDYLDISTVCWRCHGAKEIDRE